MRKKTLVGTRKIIVTGFVCLSILLVATIHFAFAASTDIGSENRTLSKPFIADIARATTVFIDLNLENKKAFEQNNVSSDSGSGVIIYKQPLYTPDKNNKLYNYFILTAAHVVKDDGLYGLRFYDNNVITIEDIQTTDDIPDQEAEPSQNISGQTSNTSADSRVRTIYRFGKYNTLEGATEKENNTVYGTDLALIKVSSDRDYPVAAIGRSEDVVPRKDKVTIVGWPVESTNQKRRLVISESEIKEVIEPDIKNGSYTLQYTSITNDGGSGGPVFNNRGEVIAIHGKGYTGTRFNNLGIQISQFIELQKNNEGYRTAFDPPLPVLTPPTRVDERALTEGRKNIPLAMNMSEQEYKESFGRLDVVYTDPTYQAILDLNKKYGGSCMKPDEDGNFGAGVYQLRAKAAIDLYNCLNAMEKTVIESKLSGSNYATKQQLKSLQKRIEDMSEEIAAIRQKNNTSVAVNQKIACDLSGPIPRTTIRTANSENRVMIEWVSKFFSSSNYDPATRCKQVSSRLQEYYKAGSLNYITSSQVGHQTVLCAALEKKDAESGQCTGGLIFTLEPKDDPKVMIQEFKNALNSDHTLIKQNSKPLLRYIDMREILAQ